MRECVLTLAHGELSPCVFCTLAALSMAGVKGMLCWWTLAGTCGILPASLKRLMC